MANSMELFCIGNAVVDVFASVNPAQLDGWGITEPAQHISREQAGRILAELGENAICSSGGIAANAAKIAAMLGIRTAFAGCVGAHTSDGSPLGAPNGGDDLAAIFEKNLTAAGVTPFLSTGTEKTGLYFAFNCGGETRVAAAPGAALEFTDADVRDDLIAGAEAIVLDGYMLDRQPLVRRIMHLAHHNGIPIALDAASVFHIKDFARNCRVSSLPLTFFMEFSSPIFAIDKGIIFRHPSNICGKL